MKRIYQSTLNILKYLYENGPVTNMSGLATRKLSNAIGGRHSTMSTLSSLLSRLEEDGLLERKVKGRKTYSISITDKGVELLKKRGLISDEEEQLPPEPPEGEGVVEVPAPAPAADSGQQEPPAAASTPEEPVPEMGYPTPEQVAEALLEKVLEKVSQTDKADVIIEGLRRRLEASQNETRSVSARYVRINADYEDLRRKLNQRESELSKLQARYNETVAQLNKLRGKLSEQEVRGGIGEENIRKLEKIMKQIPGADR